MDYLYAIFNDSVYNLISVFSDPVILLPVVVCVLISFISWLMFSLVRRGS